MKTRTLLIIGIIVIIAVSITSISLVYNQEIKLATGMMISDEKPEPTYIPDPICIVLDKATGSIGSAVTMDACYPLSDFESLGCDRITLEHIYKYTNLLDEYFDGNYYGDAIGLPEGISKEEYEKCADAIYKKRKHISESREIESFSIVEGTKIQLEGVIVDMRLGSAHQYSLFTNDPRYTFSTDSNGINLVGIHNENDLHGKIVKLSGTRTQRDLGIYVEDFVVINSLFPSPKIPNPVLTAKDIWDISIDELYENPDQYYNRFVRVAGELSEHEREILYAGVGCKTAKYATSDEFASDGPSSRHLQDGDKVIGVRIGTPDDLGKVKELLPDELKTNKVTVMGVFVPSVVERGGCDHVIHKSGYILTTLDDIKVVE